MDEVLVKNLMDRYRLLLPDVPLYDDNLASVENALDIVLPQDLKEISSVYDGGTFGAMPNYHLRLTSWGYDVVTLTLRLRELIDLPHWFIILAELDESVVFLKTMKTDDLPTLIYWIDTPNAKLLADRDPLPPELVQPFTDFTHYFAFMVEEEEKERVYEAERADKEWNMNMPKYAQLEIERRMRIPLELLPDLSGLRYTDIEDRYLDAGRLRLRKMTECGATESIFKLCKKYGNTGKYEEPIVNIYLTREEYESLHILPGHDLVKRRYRYEYHGRWFSIDAHMGRWIGLYLCECEAHSVAELIEIAFPPFAFEDVTADPRFLGASLARAHSV